VLKERLLKRGLTGGREDDNEETIGKRIDAFIKATEPTLNLYKTFGKVYPVDASRSID
jgi:adenylate kinase family enzyme